MRKIFLLVLMMIGVAYGQGNRLKPKPVYLTAFIDGEFRTLQVLNVPITGYTKINARYQWTAGAMDSGFHVPQYNGVPSGVRSGVWTAAGAIAVDTSNHRLYFYSGGSWRYSSASTSGGIPTWQQTTDVGATTSNLVGYTLNLNGSMTNFSIPNKKYVDSLTGLTNLTTKGFETSTYNSTTKTFNIPKDERVGLYLTLGKTYTRFKPVIFGSSLVFMGNSWSNGAFSTTPFWTTQICTAFNKTKVTTGVTGDDINGLVYNNWVAARSTGVDSIAFVDLTYVPTLGAATSGFNVGTVYSDGTNLTKTSNYYYGTYKAFIANYYLDADWFSVSSLADANFRDAVASDSLGTKSTTGSIGLGAFSFTKPAGKTSLVIGTYGADGTRTNQGTITVTLAGNTIFTKNFDSLNIANQGNTLYIKKGLNYEAIVLQNIPDSAATVTVTASGDSTRFDYVGYLLPKEKAVRPLYINNVGYNSTGSLWVVSDAVIDTCNQMLQNAVTDFIDYPVFIQNTNNWYVFGTTATGGHLNQPGNDSLAKAYIYNLIPQTNVPVNNAAWTQSGTSANYLSGSVGIGTSTPSALLHVSGGAGGFRYVDGFQGVGKVLQDDGTGTGVAKWTTPSTVATSVPLSGITAATGTNSINNGAFNQVWSWDGISSGTGLTIQSLSTAAASNTQTGLLVDLSQGNVNSSQTTFSARFVNTHTGTSSTNVAAQFQATGGTNNYAIIVPSGGGSVGIGTSTPSATLHSVGTARFDLGSDATGDIFYRNSSGFFTRLPIGTTKQTLHVIGGLPAWADTSASGGSGLTIGTTTIASGGTRRILYEQDGTLKDTTVFLYNGGGELQIGSASDAGAYKLQVTGDTYLSGDIFFGTIYKGITWASNARVISDISNALYLEGPSSVQIVAGGAANTRVNTTGVSILTGAYATSTLDVGGSFATAYVAKSGNYTATVSENIIKVTATSVTITLPTAVGITGREYVIVNACSGNLTVATTSSQTIGNFNTATTLTIASDGSYTLASDGAGWVIKNKF